MLFYQMVCRDSRGVLLLTLEAPNTSHSQKLFEQFVNTVEVLGVQTVRRRFSFERIQKKKKKKGKRGQSLGRRLVLKVRVRDSDQTDTSRF